MSQEKGSKTLNIFKNDQKIESQQMVRMTEIFSFKYFPFQLQNLTFSCDLSVTLACFPTLTPFSVFFSCMFSWKLQEISWLEEEEERVLQKKAEMQELEEELKRREEVVQQRETCLQQKKSLETKMLRSSQVCSYFC